MNQQSVKKSDKTCQIRVVSILTNTTTEGQKAKLEIIIVFYKDVYIFDYVLVKCYCFCTKVVPLHKI